MGKREMREREKQGEGERNRVRERRRVREKNRVRDREKRVSDRVGEIEGNGRRGREREPASAHRRRESHHRSPSPWCSSVRRWSSEDVGYNHHNGVEVRWSMDTQEEHDPINNHGAWHEVSHRRKRRLAGNRDRMERNSPKRQEEKVTWRNKRDITTFYFSRFPEGVKERDLWQIFQKWGKVWEVFIPKTKNKGGHRYGFVRFKEVQDERSLETQLDTSIYIRGMKLFVNRPRYERGRVLRIKQHGISTQRVAHTHKVHMKYQEEV